MAKTIFEQMGGTYTMQGDYRLPDLTIQPEEERPIGVGAAPPAVSKAAS